GVGLAETAGTGDGTAVGDCACATLKLKAAAGASAAMARQKWRKFMDGLQAVLDVPANRRRVAI
ncbi:hypothetical protein, partial [Bradyrhizobium sp.]|uniref:hypothetical protein n=1 Tax=Bradyrhizobium sp. TaxID=376 RepID=UPI003C492192